MNDTIMTLLKVDKDLVQGIEDAEALGEIWMGLLKSDDLDKRWAAFESYNNARAALFPDCYRELLTLIRIFKTLEKNDADQG